jgi:hypothetical protein
MTTIAPEFDNKKLARIAGAFYLIIIICGIFSEGFVRMSLVVPGDAAATANNIQNSEFLFRLGLVGDLFMVISDVIVAVLFFYLLRPVSEILSTLAAFFRLGQAAIIGINSLNHFSPLLLLAVTSQGGWSEGQVNEQILFFMSSHKYGYLISQVFFSFNCAVMGYLLLKSPLFPNILGYGVGLAAFVYFTDSIVHFLEPNLASNLALMMVVPVVAELSLCLWLLIKGVKRKGKV